MPRHYCCVPHCHSLNKRDKVSFIRFPKNEELTKQWMLAVGRGPGFNITKNTRICSKHFVTGKRSYCPELTDYVPSLFPSEKDKPSRCKSCKRLQCKGKTNKGQLSMILKHYVRSFMIEYCYSYFIFTLDILYFQAVRQKRSPYRE